VSGTDDLTAFVKARLDEDEETANAVRPKDWDDIGWAGVGATATAHAARFDPARVLREVEAKRAIVDLASKLVGREWPDWHKEHGIAPTVREEANHLYTLKILAAVYNDHPDYRQEWTP
jgi:hypothetical protein